MQAKLVVGAIDDPAERQADRIAAQVVRAVQGGEPLQHASGNVQRACASCDEERDKLLERAPASGSTPTREAPAGVDEGLKSPSQGIGEPARSLLEQRLGWDLGDIRLHDGPRASASAARIGARAYTLGRDIVFGAGELAPQTSTGLQLLAHEVVHTLQQRGGAGLAAPSTTAGTLQRKECSTTRSCSPPDRCARPDPGEEGTQAPSTWWNMTVNVDVEAGDFEAALMSARLGHTNVRFSESNGRQYTYGFYPAAQIPDENHRGVAGCVNHPDPAHDACVDTIVPFPLTQRQYEAGLSAAQALCRTGHYYGLNSANVSYTCTTFAADVAAAAGKRLPSSTSRATTIFYQAVPPIDNPNTLNENLLAQSRGMPSDETNILGLVELAGPRLLERYAWQDKARWINVLLEEFWISERDVAAIERICSMGMPPADLPRIAASVAAGVAAMHSSSQQARVRRALGGGP